MLERNELQQKIFSILEELFEIPSDKIQLESRLFEDLDLDSIDAVDLIVHLQQYVGKRIDPQQFKGVRTVQDIIVAAENVLNESPAVLDHV